MSRKRSAAASISTAVLPRGGGRSHPVIGVAALGLLLAACQQPKVFPPASSGSSSLIGGNGGTGTLGACTEPATRSCEIQLSTTPASGTTPALVDCFRGTQICTGGTWGACTAGLVTREVRPSAPPTAPEDTGMHLKQYSAPATCTGTYANACDPRCQFFQEHDSSTTIASIVPPPPDSIDGDFCKYALYSPNGISIKGGSVSGNVASPTSVVIGASGAATVTGDLATCGDLTVENNSNLVGTGEVAGTFFQQNGFNVTGAGTKYMATGTVEANRVALWVAGANTSTQTTNDVWSTTFQNNGPATLIQGGVVAPLVPADPSLNHVYSTWTTNGTNYSWHSATRAAIVGGFTDSIFAKCTSGVAATAIPTQTITPSCGSAITDSSLGTVNSGVVKSEGPGHYGNVTITGTLALTGPGYYTFDSLTQNAASTLDLQGIGTGVYHINICNSWNPSSNFSVTFSDAAGVTASNVDYTKIRWYYGGTNQVIVNSGTTGLPGAITSPSATIEINPGKPLNGIVHAQSIVMDQGSLVPAATSDPCGPKSCPVTTTTLFDQTYTSTCPDGTDPQWTYLIWDSVIPTPDASIAFEIAGGNSAADVAGSPSFVPIHPVAKSNATASLDTQVCPISGGASTCPVSLANVMGSWPLVLRIRARATYGCLPSQLTLNAWKVFYTCVDNR